MNNWLMALLIICATIPMVAGNGAVIGHQSQTVKCEGDD